MLSDVFFPHPPVQADLTEPSKLLVAYSAIKASVWSLKGHPGATEKQAWWQYKGKVDKETAILYRVVTWNVSQKMQACVIYHNLC